MSMIRRKGTDCCCSSWKDMVKQLWENYQEIIKSIKIGGVTVYPDGTGLTDITDALNNAVSEQITIELSDYAKLSDLANFIETSDIVNVLIDTTLSADASTVTVTHLRYDAPSDVDPMPVASATQAGIINAADYQAFLQMQQDIQTLQSISVTYAVTLPSDDPSQAQITAAFTSAYPTVTLVAGIRIADYTRNLVYQYDSTQWINQPMSISVPVATDTVLGGVLSSNAAGQIAVNVGGTMSLNGYDALVSRLTNLETRMTAAEGDLDDAVTGISSTSGGGSGYNMTMIEPTLGDGTTGTAAMSAKYYTGTGQATDGSMTQKAITDELTGIRQVPDATSASAGDVLTLDSNKVAAWQAPSGGGVAFTSTSFPSMTSAIFSLIYDVITGTRAGHIIMADLTDYYFHECRGCTYSYGDEIYLTYDYWDGTSINAGLIKLTRSSMTVITGLGIADMYLIYSDILLP